MPARLAQRRRITATFIHTLTVFLAALLPIGAGRVWPSLSQWRGRPAAGGA